MKYSRGLGEMQNPEHSRSWHLCSNMTWPFRSTWMDDSGTVGPSLDSTNSAIDRLATWEHPTKNLLLVWNHIAGLGEMM